ncbi:Holliday junction resolvase RuvX [Nesterenkonia halotolerans]|uniref:Putative pre-16S rRNA nuclease n=1 Tax=Nesterenkonia halotolerans TaxID=225325 RepID=A0ABR9J3J3_9MICC|nr:Holliday junction resolvase RuvX [Nesterenkonia halotolerans]MBE1513534.1 putative Holliday junction resolvase [Nesterenkonia halotolerans]
MAEPTPESPAAGPPRAGVRLGVDVGEARVGLAASDPDALVATPVMTLRRDHNRASDLKMLLKIIRERKVSAIYVGLPLSLSGAETLSTEKARDYAQQLAQLLKEAEIAAGVYLVDERLSTVSAAEKMRASGVTSREQRDRIDQAAAVEILTHAMDLRQAWGREPGAAVSAD